MWVFSSLLMSDVIQMISWWGKYVCSWICKLFCLLIIGKVVTAGYVRPCVSVKTCTNWWRSRRNRLVEMHGHFRRCFMFLPQRRCVQGCISNLANQWTWSPKGNVMEEKEKRRKGGGKRGARQRKAWNQSWQLVWPWCGSSYWLWWAWGDYRSDKGGGGGGKHRCTTKAMHFTGMCSAPTIQQQPTSGQLLSR